MGWNISHGTDRNSEYRRSYTQISNLGQHLAHVLSAADWRSIQYLFNRRSGDPFTVAAAEADRIAALLYQAANHRLMPADWAEDVQLLADAADRAAAAGESWTWR
ncbi:hypothetical protein AB0M94_38925 [Streptomyces xanthochromogenes]|uniref:DUF7739 domain-containing protein n=1 Tax=Streptomyces xanthochromogenes TaxID=67384 RepID=UPI003414A72D